MNRPAARSQNGRNSQRQRSQGRRAPVVDIWRAPHALPNLAWITVSHDVGALIRSLGDPPLNGGMAAGYYFEIVLQRAAGIAQALALSADLLSPTDD